MNKIIMSAVVMLVISGCKVGGSNTVEPEVEKVAQKLTGEVIWVKSLTPFSSDSKIANNIKEECKLEKKLPDFIESYSVGNGINVQLKENVSRSSKGKVLDVQIVDAVSQGHAFTGHRKYVKVKGTLYNNGSKVAGFTAGRVSGGGFFGAYKGSCSVLGRTVKVIGRDIGTWLKNPKDGVNLGDNL